MKKASLLAATMMLIALNAKAQDTTWDIHLSLDYFYNENSWFDSDTGYVGYGGSSTYTLIGKRFVAKDTMTVYGIAAMLEKPDLGEVELPLVIDTSYDNAYEWVALYAAGPDSLAPMSEQKAIHVRDSAPAYYLATKMYNPTRGQHVTEVHGVYELYFNQPVEVEDSFYVAMTRRSWIGYDGNDMPLDPNHMWSSWPIGPVSYTPVYMEDYHIHFYDTMDHIELYSPRRGWVHENIIYRMFFFPILTPKENPMDTVIVDTSIVDTTQVDTVGISLRLLERYIGLHPNPAAERVLVTSSFGLRSVELYNAAGIKVHEQRATGYSATLDIRSLPDGPYLARISTPRGTVTKKLLVRR